jgi:hypothetical protein
MKLIFSIIYITFYIYEYHKYSCQLNYDYPFQDPTLPIDVRLENLMSLLTPEEKVILLILTIIIYFYLFLRSICYGWVKQHQVLFYRS